MPYVKQTVGAVDAGCEAECRKRRMPYVKQTVGAEGQRLSGDDECLDGGTM